MGTKIESAYQFDITMLTQTIEVITAEMRVVRITYCKDKNTRYQVQYCR